MCDVSRNILRNFQQWISYDFDFPQDSIEIESENIIEIARREGDMLKTQLPHLKKLLSDLPLDDDTIDLRSSDDLSEIDNDEDDDGEIQINDQDSDNESGSDEENQSTEFHELISDDQEENEFERAERYGEEYAANWLSALSQKVLFYRLFYIIYLISMNRKPINHCCLTKQLTRG